MRTFLKPTRYMRFSQAQIIGIKKALNGLDLTIDIHQKTVRFVKVNFITKIAVKPIIRKQVITA